MRRSITFFIPTAVALCAACGSLWAAPIVSYTWDTGGDLEGWANDPGLSTLSNPASGGVGDTGYLDIQFPGSGVPQDDYIYLATNNADFTGLAAYFDFIARDTAPSTLALFFRGASGRVWLFEFTVSQLNTWVEYSVTFDYGLGWGGGPWSLAQFNTDLASIDRIGIWIDDGVSAGVERYGLDDFEVDVPIPEPGTYYMLAAVFLSLTGTFRRRAGDLLGKLRGKTS